MYFNLVILTKGERRIMEILEDMNITELKLVNGEKLKIVVQDKHFFLQAKKDDILVEGISLQTVLDCIIQAKLFSKSQKGKIELEELIDRYFLMYK